MGKWLCATLPHSSVRVVSLYPAMAGNGLVDTRDCEQQQNGLRFSHVSTDLVVKKELLPSTCS